MQVTDATHHFETVADAKTFALAGNAILTLESLRTGAHFTYKIRESKPAEGSTASKAPVHFVSLLNGPDNTNDFMYIGLIKPSGEFTLTAKSRAGANAASVVAFKYFWSLQGEAFPAQLVVHHENRCGRCNRTLTVPESITSGLGPECRELMGLDL